MVPNNLANLAKNGTPLLKKRVKASSSLDFSDFKSLKLEVNMNINNCLKTVHLTGDSGTGSGSLSRATGDVPQDVKFFLYFFCYLCKIIQQRID